MEGVHQNVVLCLENKHVIKGARNAQRHTVRETALTERIDEENCGRCCNRCRVSNANPRAHTESVRKFPLTTHIAEDTDEEVEYNELVRTTVIQPLIQRGSFPDGIEVKTDCIRRRYNCTRNDVVSVHQGTSNWFTDAVNIDRRCCNECSNEADGCCQQSWDHQHTEPTDIQTVVS